MRAACERRVREARSALLSRSGRAVRDVLMEIIDDEQSARASLPSTGATGGGGGGGGGGAAAPAAAGDSAMQESPCGGGQWDEAFDDALTAGERADLLAHLEAVLKEEGARVEAELSQQHAVLREADEHAELAYLVELCER